MKNDFTDNKHWVCTGSNHTVLGGGSVSCKCRIQPPLPWRLGMALDHAIRQRVPFCQLTKEVTILCDFWLPIQTANELCALRAATSSCGWAEHSRDPTIFRFLRPTLRTPTYTIEEFLSASIPCQSNLTWATNFARIAFFANFWSTWHCLLNLPRYSGVIVNCDVNAWAFIFTETVSGMLEQAEII